MIRRQRLSRRRRVAPYRPGVAAGAIAVLALIGIVASWCGGDAEAPATRSTATPAFSPTRTIRTPDAAPSAVCRPPYPTPPYDAETVFCADPAPLEPAELVRVIDGDTIVVRLAGGEETIRVFGIDTPERGEVCFREAADRIGALASDGVRLLPDARNRDRFGRLLRYVYTNDGRSIDALLIAEGLAHAWRDDGALRLALIALEERARAAGTGCLWN
jgi:micrococcal nuclease